MQLCSVGTVVLNHVANKDIVGVIIFIGDTTISDVHWSITLVNSHWMAIIKYLIFEGIDVRYRWLCLQAKVLATTVHMDQSGTLKSEVLPLVDNYNVS